MATAEYSCPSCGVFELRIVDPPDEVTCPDCDAVSPWTITSAPAMRVPYASAAVHGGASRPDHPLALDTRELGEGMPLSEWRKKRAAKWADHDRKDERRKDMARATDHVLNKPDGVVRERPDQRKSRLARLAGWMRGGGA
jgi:hypothetical protein